jgi:hypothetical protein
VAGAFDDLLDARATPLRRCAVAAHVVREIVGHSAIEVTVTIYAHVSLEEKRMAMLKLGEALK